MGRIPEHILEEVLSRTDIVELVSSVIPLKKAGRNFKACCPFHQEKTPSFVVSPEKQIYHCFGCGESGNAIGFLMRYERMEFLEALRTLAQKAGIPLPDTRRASGEQEQLSSKLYKVNEIAASFYAGVLRSAAGERARAYVRSRGISDETARVFLLGCAPDAWDAFILHARSRNIPLTLLEKAGLILPKQGGGYYDRFRNRLVFPIADMRGRILGFGARVLENSVPKYINSPETYIYSKGKHLYGLGASKERILGDDRVVVVEGYLDCLIPYQAGMRSVVASLGTALTPEQVRRIKRYTRNIVVVYDADTAGRLAALRSLDIFADEECEARVVSLPKGHDPDSFIRKEGLDAFRRLVNEAESVFSYKLNVLVSQYPVEDSQGKAKIASYMLETIGRFKNAVLVSEYVRRLAQKLDVSEEALRLELKKQKPGLRPSKTSLAAKAPRTYQCSRTEKLLVKLMLEEADLIHWVREHLEPADFQDARISRIVRLMFEMAAQGRRIEPCVLVSAMNEEDVSQIVCESLFLPEDVSYEQKEKIVGDCITRLKEEKVRNMRVRLQEQISAAQSAGDEAAVERLMNEFHGLIKQQG